MAISFPGIINPIKMMATRQPGTEPSKAIIFAQPQATTPDTSGTATLSFDFNGTTISWPNSLLDLGSLDVQKNGIHQIFVILDRRWLWAKSYITRAFNVRQADGSIDSSTSSSLAAIATALLTAMGDPSADVSAITSTEKPELVINYQRCIDVWEDIFTKRGYVLSLMPDNTVKVFVMGTGNVLPNNSDVCSAQFSLNPPTLPNVLSVVLKKTIVQSMLLCQPVGLDTDGTIKPIASLTYAPASWAGVDLESMNFIATNDARQCALRSVGKWYQIQYQGDGTQNLTDGVTNYLGAGGEINVASAWQYLPIMASLVDTSTDVFGKKTRDLPYVLGTFYGSPVEDSPPLGVNTSAFTRVDKRDWALDRDRGIVMFKTLARKTSAGTYTFADVYLMCAYSVSNPYVKDKLVRQLSLGGIGEDAEHVEELQRQIITTYTAGTSTVSSISDNKAAMNTAADLVLANLALRYQTIAQQVIQYRGLYNFQTDGVALQIRWDVAMEGLPQPFGTSVSLYAEGLPLLPTQEDRPKRKIKRIKPHL